MQRATSLICMLMRDAAIWRTIAKFARGLSQVACNWRVASSPPFLLALPDSPSLRDMIRTLRPSFDEAEADVDFDAEYVLSSL